MSAIAVPEYYLPFMDIMRYLSDYKIKIYPSRYSALSAVAYGQVDAVMVDMISGNFIVNKFYQSSIQLLKPLYIDTAGFAFALNPKERRLKRIMDIALGEILEGKRAEVAKRWNGGPLHRCQQNRPEPRAMGMAEQTGEDPDCGEQRHPAPQFL